ncbi:MAG TPA: GlsB/YeaQ/YmgE family stress response membrane protein [Thermoanaerobaculia bacterium]
MVEILTWIIVGLVAGVLASFVVGRGYGLLGDIILGIIGAFVGGWIFRQMGWGTVFPGLIGTIFVAFIGAVVLLLLLRLIRRA